ncbi:helix-turn-helix domain-containing protein [Actinomadura livida]|uniref:Helix-turn-helix transcriptional regulator n=1 Tax=Actinomadura livida TaxID=79909 RepID=A0A7W7I6S7_9ACTN|nr:MULTISPECIES: helix-turn-helix transcriptional regulator [Actinomadura]MBB4771612.1 transcriptional regulator with XRE-family HTH domain [Actinomadura catellatispora]GGU01383.1 transcriptional regulator [Actinomadura livida]
MSKRPPTVRRRRLGTQLRKIREERGLTPDEAAALLMMSKSALSRMENAQVVARAHEVDYIAMTYGLPEDDDLRIALVGLATGGRSRDWIRHHKELNRAANYGEYVLLEQDASELFSYEGDLIPGLLQTPGYARAVLTSVPKNADRDIDQAVAFRIARQDALTRTNPLVVKAVVGEAVLCQWVGTPEVMIHQLRHLLELQGRPNIELQVLPFTAARKPALDGSFGILHVEAGNFPIVVIDGLLRSLFLEEEEEVAAYRDIQARLCMVALSETETRERIKRAIQHFESGQAEGTVGDLLAEEQP